MIARSVRAHNPQPVVRLVVLEETDYAIAVLGFGMISELLLDELRPPLRVVLLNMIRCHLLFYFGTHTQNLFFDCTDSLAIS